MFDNLDKVELKQRESYLKEGTYQVTIKSLQSSDAMNIKPKTPFIEYIAETSSGHKARLKFQGSNESTPDNVKTIRTTIMKEFLTNCGITDFSDWVASCKQAIGKQLYVCLAKREYWTNDKDGKPVIRNVVEYKFSSRTPITFDEKYNKPLSMDDMRKYNEAMKFAAADAVTATEETSSSENSDLPF